MIIIAKVGSTYRLKGKLKLYFLVDSIEYVLSYDKWYIKKPSDTYWLELSNSSVSQRNNKFFICFSDANTKEAASKYINSLLAITRSALQDIEDIDEFYCSDLIGMQVKNKEGEIFGQVQNIIDTGANEVLYCKREKALSPYLIPFVKDHVIEVDKCLKLIIVDWKHDY